jgi:hypothetical protein
MNRRPLLALLLALAALGPSALLATAAHADDGSDDHGDDSDDSSNEGSEDNDNSSGDAGEDDGEDTGTNVGDSGEGGEDDHDEALRAVTAKDAIPLNQMLWQFVCQFDGTIVDITLIKSTDRCDTG